MSDRATKYLDRIDGHLPKLANDEARRAFLDDQLSRWEREYRRFFETDGASAPTATADDFTLTITGLGKRQAQLRRAA